MSSAKQNSQDKSNRVRILLTGGSGFIGKNILESSLAEKYEIIAPSHKELDLADDDSVRSFFNKNSFDAVIHCAGKPGHRNAPDPTNIFYTDMRMFMNLLQHRGRLGKMIVLSSGAIYDQRYPIVKAREEDYRLQLPVDEHALYRRVSAELIEKMKDVVELRIFGIFGRYEDYTIRFISNAICKTLFDLPITIRQNRKFDYLYVEDLMPVLEYFLTHEANHKAYNITPDASVDLLELAEKIKGQSGKNLLIQVVNGGKGLEYSGSNERVKKEITNLRFTPLGLSIAQLYSWYEQHRQDIKKDVLLQDK